MKAGISAASPDIEGADLQEASRMECRGMEGDNKLRGMCSQPAWLVRVVAFKRIKWTT